MFARLFAHAGELHGSSNETLFHFLSAWWVALPVFFVATYIAAFVVFSLTNKSIKGTVLVLMVVFFALALTLYDKSPAISVLSIISATVSIIGIILASLTTPTNKK